jgi:Cu2+-exporting ATPase
LQTLRAQGLSVALCSGDAEQAVARMADAIGIPRNLPHDAAHARARQTPEDKLAYVRERQAGGEIVAMVGDGINDAPVLAGADVSIALADGAALAQRAADFVVGGGDLRRIPQAVALARRSRRIVRENFAWAIGYNLLALPLAAAGMVTPWIAAIGMALSSLLVTLNALRLTRVSTAMAPDAHTPRI